MLQDDGIRSTSLPTGDLVEVLGHYDAGGGALSLGSQSIEEFIQYLRQQAGLDPSGLAAEILRAKAGERLARTLAAPKISLPNSPFTELNNGALDDGAGGIRWPAGSTGRNSTIRARFNLTASDIAANAGRPVTFVSLYKVSPGFLTAFKDNLGNLTLSNVAQGVTGAVITVTAIQADTVMVEMVATLTGSENLPAQIFFVGNTTQGVAAEVTARLVYTAWFPSDATGTSDVLARLAQPYPSAVGELIGVATVRRVTAGGAQPAFGDRGLLIPFGQSGAGSFLIAGIPAQGLAAGVVVRGRFLFGASLDLDPATVLAAGGATVAMASGPDVGAASWTLTKLAPGIWEGTFTYTLVGGERLFEFFLAVTGGSSARGGRGFIRLEQGALEIVSTPLTTTANAQVARYMEQARARQALVPDFRRAVTVRADGTSIDGLTRIRDGVAAVASAAGPVDRNRVYVDAGTYTDEVGIGAGTVETSTAIDPPDYIDIIGLGRPEDALILARRPADQAQQEILQALRHRFTGSVENLSFDVENVRYALHLEAGNAPNRAVQTYRRLRIRHRGSTMWSSPSAIGVGQHEGNRQRFTDVHASSPYAAFGMHNNVNWRRPAFTLIEDGVLHGTGVDSRSIALTSCGAGIVSRVVVRNTVLSGHVRIDTDFLAGAQLPAHKANRFEYALFVRNSSPIDVIAVCNVPALTLTSVPGATSAVAVSNTAAPVLFGAQPDVREGWIDYAAWLCSYHAVGVLPGEADPGVTLAARLGDCRSVPLYLSVAWDGLQAVTITLDQDYRSMSNDAIVLHLNLRLAAAMGGSTGGRLFSLSTPYNGRPPVVQPDREGRGRNAGSGTIMRGMALAWSGRDVRVMTSADPVGAFAGVALNDAIPNRSVRWLEPGAWLGQAQITFDGNPSLALGQRFQVSAAVPGALVLGADRPLLAVRSVEPHGACLAIVDASDNVPAIDARTKQLGSLSVPGFSEVVAADNGSVLRATRDTGETVVAALQVGDLDTVQQQVSASPSGMLLSGIVSALLSTMTVGQEGAFVTDKAGAVLASYVNGLLSMPDGYGVGEQVRLSFIESSGHLVYITDAAGNVAFEVGYDGVPNYVGATTGAASAPVAYSGITSGTFAALFTDAAGEVLLEIGADGTLNWPDKGTVIAGDPTPLMGPELFVVPGQTLKIYPRNLIQDGSGATPIVATLASVANQSGDWQPPYVEEGAVSLSIDPARLGPSALLAVRPAGQDTSTRREVPVTIRKAAVPFATQRTPKILGIGDSIIDRELFYWLRGRLSTYNIAANFLGTQSSVMPAGVSGEIRTEAHSGWQAGDFTNRRGAKPSVPVGGEASYLAGSRADRQNTNPVLRDATGSDPASLVRYGKVFDVRFYLDRFGIPDPDIVLMEIGSNDAAAAGGLGALQPAFSNDLNIMVSQIRAALPNVIIGLFYMTQPREALDPVTYGPMRAAIIRDYLARARGSDTKLHVVPTWAHMTIETGYQLLNRPVDPVTGVTTAAYGDDLHPIGVARQQMADALAAFVAYYS